MLHAILVLYTCTRTCNCIHAIAYMYSTVFVSYITVRVHTAGVSRLFCPKNQIIWELKIAQYKMYTKILAQGTKFGSGTTGLDHPDIRSSHGRD